MRLEVSCILQSTKRALQKKEELIIHLDNVSYKSQNFLLWACGTHSHIHSLEKGWKKIHQKLFFWIFHLSKILDYCQMVSMIKTWQSNSKCSPDSSNFIASTIANQVLYTCQAFSSHNSVFRFLKYRKYITCLEWSKHQLGSNFKSARYFRITYKLQNGIYFTLFELLGARNTTSMPHGLIILQLTK